MADSPHCVQRSVRIYAALVKAYPASFRQEYADEMVLVFRDLATEAWRRRRHIGLLFLWFRVLGDLAWTAPKEHINSRKTYKGGLAVGIKSLLMREIVPDPDFSFKTRLCLVLMLFIPFGFFIECLIVGKLMSMNVTESQRFLGILLAAALVLQFIGFGILSPLAKWKDRPTYYVSLGQIVLYSISLLTLILGSWKLASMAITEYELILGLLILFELMLTLMGMAQVLPMIHTALADNSNNNPVASAETK